MSIPNSFNPVGKDFYEIIDSHVYVKSHKILTYGEDFDATDTEMYVDFYYKNLAIWNQVAWAQNSYMEIYGMQITNNDTAIRFGYGNTRVNTFSITLGQHIGILTPDFSELDGVRQSHTGVYLGNKLNFLVGGGSNIGIKRLKMQKVKNGEVIYDAYAVRKYYGKIGLLDLISERFVEGV